MSRQELIEYKHTKGAKAAADLLLQTYFFLWVPTDLKMTMISGCQILRKWHQDLE